MRFPYGVCDFNKVITEKLFYCDRTELSAEKLQSIPLMQARMEEAKKQVIQYGDTLEQKYDNMRLKKYAVVSLGFERLWWMETTFS